MAGKTNNANLKLIKDKEAAEDSYQRRQAVEKSWKAAAESWKLTPLEIKQRVGALRAELESYARVIEAMPFDIARDDFPQSLDQTQRKWTGRLVEEIDPRIQGLFDKIDAFAHEHGCGEIDFNAKLFEMKMDCEETAFRVGMLAGLVLAGCPKDQVDRFERGLVFSLSCDTGLTRK